MSDGVYTSRTDYDDWGRPVTTTYQRNSGAQKIFSTRFNNMGYMARVERGGLVLWTATAQDASNRPTTMELGNGLVQSKSFNVHTGRLDTGAISAGGVARVQEGYVYDLLGNATTRSQSWDAGGFMEVLHYDTLNRLDDSKIGSVEKVFTYDLAGNMQTKTGTGTYVYPPQGVGAVRPHAVSTVTPTAGAVQQFTYDSNGNLTGGTTYAATWTSFDMPIQLAKGSVWANFTYGPEHQRTSQTRSDGSKVVYAGAQEVETAAGGTTVKTYWPNGIGVEIDRGASATELNWMHVDRVGSVIALTTETGVIREKLEFDVWGKRRSTDDNDATPDSLDEKTDNRGFTGHEMLDQLDLVHMNGRIYIPSIGRFISADSLVNESMNGQAYNRYSYVSNNPTNLTDPTGFAAACADDASCGGATTAPEPAREPPIPPLPPADQIQKVSVVGTRLAKESGPTAGFAGATSIAPIAGAAVGFAAAPWPVKAAVTGIAAYLVYKIVQSKQNKDDNTGAEPNNDKGDKSGDPDGEGPKKLPPLYKRNYYKKPTQTQRDEALAKDPICPYCKERPSNSLDHVESQKTDWDKGGYKDSRDVRNERINDPSNLSGSCNVCNSAKGARPIGQGEGEWTPPINR